MKDDYDWMNEPLEPEGPAIEPLDIAFFALLFVVPFFVTGGFHG